MSRLEPSLAGATRRIPGGLPRETARLLIVVLPVSLAGTVVAVLAAASLAVRPPAAGAIVGALVLLAAAAAAEAFPVPIEGVSAGGVSLAASFLVGAAIVYEWSTAILLSLAARGVIEVIQRRPVVKIVFNSAVFALSGAAAGAATFLTDGRHTIAGLLVEVAAASYAFYVVNLMLVAAVVARVTVTSFVEVVRQSVRWTLIPFAIMASISLMLAVLWERSPFLSAALAGPLIAVGLYQRSVHRVLEATRLAKTDPLTGLGNHRAFQESVEAGLASHTGRLTLCLIDVDGFKQINDRFGHQTGDRVLMALATYLRGNGEAFRLGGDEFALVLPGVSLDEARRTAVAVVDRIGRERHAEGGVVTVSAGLALAPEHGDDADRLFGAADVALYQAKRRGRNQVHVFDPRVAQLERARVATAEAARLDAAWGLAELVDTADGLHDGDAPVDGHARRVSDLAARVAARIALDAEHVELVRLAARLHDLGKLAVPVEILRKPGSLGEREWRVLEEHPETGRRILTSLGAGAIADWVLHHHERWDGTGYPSGLAGEEIPLPARIIFVADAFDAITSGRPYQGPKSEQEAIEELQRCAGSQFDPGVVAALTAELEAEAAERERLSA